MTGRPYPRSSTDGTLAERLRLMRAARRVGGEVRWPFRLPHPKGRGVAHQVELGAGAWIGRGAWLNVVGPDARLRIGEGTCIGEDFTVATSSSVDIGSGCLFSARVVVLDHLHDIEGWVRDAWEQGLPPRFSWALTPGRPVTIGPGTWLGINVAIMPGVSIGQGCVVGANSVVTRDLPDYSVAAGAPARVLRTIDPAAPDLSRQSNAWSEAPE
jgi:acetyltransferase-like isoleucine patch superfamily enzyme